MLELDVELVRRVAPEGASLLDLGCGTGDIFLALLDRLSHVTAVDMIDDFLARIPDDPRIEPVVAEITAFEPKRTYDAAILFGVVTHLSEADERRAYAILRAAAPDGTVVVKNQCGREHDVDVDGHSEAFGGRYVGRYPAVEAQAARLREYFGEVEVVRYPDAVNRWPDSLHAAFVCR
jgi:SAM-dependent methyltransferase